MTDSPVGRWALSFLTLFLVIGFSGLLEVAAYGWLRWSNPSLALRAGEELRHRDPRGPRRASEGSYLFDAKLERYRRQFEHMDHHPGFVLNQWLRALGIRRNFRLDRYCAGILVQRWSGSHHGRKKGHREIALALVERLEAGQGW